VLKADIHNGMLRALSKAGLVPFGMVFGNLGGCWIAGILDKSRKVRNPGFPDGNPSLETRKFDETHAQAVGENIRRFVAWGWYGILWGFCRGSGGFNGIRNRGNRGESWLFGRRGRLRNSGFGQSKWNGRFASFFGF